jgi:RES domain
VEAVLRDEKNGVVGDFPFPESELHTRRYAEIEIGGALNVVDLTRNGAVRIGMPSDVLRRSVQAAARRWSLAFYTHPAAPDGIMYPSRLNGETNLAIYDRAISKLVVTATCDLINATDLAAVLDDLQVRVV